MVECSLCKRKVRVQVSFAPKTPKKMRTLVEGYGKEEGNRKRMKLIILILSPIILYFIYLSLLILFSKTSLIITNIRQTNI